MSKEYNNRWNVPIVNPPTDINGNPIPPKSLNSLKNKDWYQIDSFIGWWELD